MTRKDKPLSPRLSIYHWHWGMVASIAHRASGVLLILCIPMYIWLLYGMTGSPQSFEHIVNILHSLWGRLALWAASVSVFYHFCNGIRFLCLDIGWGESQVMMRYSAGMVLGIAGMSAAVFGVLLW